MRQGQGREATKCGLLVPIACRRARPPCSQTCSYSGEGARCKRTSVQSVWRTVKSPRGSSRVESVACVQTNANA
eukprot:1011561-Alexandrium_andersonii.AAC.1